jgi:hypothetical protein
MRVVRYLAGTVNYGLRFSKRGLSSMVAYSDGDWAGDRIDGLSRSGVAVKFMDALVAWRSKKQPCVARSSAESELIALDLTVREVLWLRKLCKGLDLNLSEDGGAPTIPIFEDNVACLNIANGSRWSNQTKHVDVKYFAVREDVINQRVSVESIPTKDNLADMFTKPLQRVKFERFRDLIGCVEVPVV